MYRNKTVYNVKIKHKSFNTEEMISGLPSMVLTATGIGFLKALSLSVAANTQPK